MPATPTASDARTARRPWAPRWLVLAHRYLGIVFGLLMLLWFASGVVMLFVHWPELGEEARVRGLAPIPWTGCCAAAPALPDAQVLEDARVEELAGRAVLRAGGAVVDLATGRPVAPLDRAAAMAVAERHARLTGRPFRAAGAWRVVRDQWTVTGYFNDRRPFWRVRLADAAATDIYVSVRTGEVAQQTTRAERILNWLGPIPHWLYFETLRSDVKLWTQVIVWTSMAGVFLTVTGLWLGLVAWRPWRDARLSPFRGTMLWHHLAGLAAGLLTLTWTASGLFSMQPWGWLDSPPDPRFNAYGRAEITSGEFVAALSAVAARAPGARQVRLAPLEGRLRLMADGTRLDAEGRPAPLTSAELARAARALGPVAGQGLMTAEDAYWYGHHEPARLPVWRVVLADGTRAYLDPRSGEVLGRFDAAAKGFRWLHLGLHRLDFVPGFDRGGGWAAVMTALLGLAGFGVATGVWLGFRRAGADVSRLRPRRG